MDKGRQRGRESVVGRDEEKLQSMPRKMGTVGDLQRISQE